MQISLSSWANVGVRRSLALLIVFLVFSSISAGAVDPHRLISQYGHTAWRTQDGFLDQPTALTQTSDGYIWVGTLSGLLRFDGVTFKSWTPPGGDPLPHITSLLGARDGSLWIGTSNGLFVLKDGMLSRYDKNRKAPGVSAIIQDHSGTIWLTRYKFNEGEGPLCRVTGVTLQCFGKNDGIPSRFALGLAEDGEGKIWFGCQALCRWSPGTSEIYFREQFKDWSGNGISRVAIGPSDSVWASLEGTGPRLGVQYYTDGKWSSYVVPGFDGSTVVSQALFTDRNHTLWIGTESAGLYHVHDGCADHYGSAQGLSGDVVQSIYEDNEGNIWVTTDRGIDSFRDLAVATFSGNEGLVGAAVNSVLAVGDGSVWAANQHALNIIRPKSIPVITTPHGLPGRIVESMFKDSAEQVWLGIDKKIVTYKNGHFFELKNSAGSPAGPVGGARAFTEDIEHNIWALTDSEQTTETWLLRIKGDRIEQKSRIDEIFPQALSIEADQLGDIWIVSLRGKLGRWRNGTVEPVVSLDDPSQILAYSLFIDSDSAVWTATSRGLFRWKHGSLSRMDSSNGLPCSRVYSMIKDNEGAVWLYEKCALVRISRSNWANWVKSPESKVSVRAYDALDGAQPDISEPYQPLVSKSSDGRLWFVSDSFVQMVDPGQSVANAIPPPVHIEELIANHKTHNAEQGLSLPPLANELEINYTALSLMVPRRVLFRYKLEGHDQQWQEAGTRRQAFYNDLGPGHYRFRVIACNNDGVWNDNGAALDFAILPAYYQTVWFRAICTTVFLLLLWMAYQMRVRKIANFISARFDERLAERTRIARDLHDTFLQTIQGSKLVADAALKQSTDTSRMRGALEQLSMWLGRATEEGRAALNSLRTSTTEANDLAEAFRRAIDECRIENSMESSFSVVGETREMHPIVRDEVYRIGYEAIRNACVHSQASKLQVTLTYNEGLGVCVVDDGVGMDTSVAAHGKEGHFGLKGMRERAARIAGKLTVTSSRASGTEVKLVVPGKIIYRKMASAPEHPRNSS